MKLRSSLLVLSPLVLSAHAADCSEPDKEVYERAASEMMWSIRGWLCSNAWWQSITAGPQGAWCDNQGGIVGAYEGQFTIHGMQSQQQCWVHPFPSPSLSFLIYLIGWLMGGCIGYH
jgi:hypothetical protein